MSKKYIPLACANCERTLNVRTAYLGRWVTCNHCETTFLARQVDALTVSASSDEFPAIRSEEGGAKIAATLNSAFVQAFASPGLTRDGASRVSTREVRPGWREMSPAELERLHDQIGTLRERSREAESLNEELQSARDENARLVATAQVLKSELVERVSEVERLGRSMEELVGLRAERDRGEAQRRAIVAELEQLRSCLKDVQRSREEDKARYKSEKLELARLQEDARRLWETDRHELLARWEDERRASQDEDRARASTQQHLLHAQIEDAGRRFEQDRRALQAEIDGLGHALQQTREKADQASQREAELTEQIRALQDEIDRRLHEVAVESGSAQEALDGLRQELEARSHQEMTVERERSDRTIDALRREIDQLRAERDRLADGWSQAVASLEAIEDQHRGELHALGLELQEARYREDRANQREAELIGELQGLGAEHDRLRREIEAERQKHLEHCDTLSQEREARLEEQRASDRDRADLVERANRREAELSGQAETLGAELAGIKGAIEAERRAQQDQGALLEARFQEQLAAERERADLVALAARDEVEVSKNDRDHAREQVVSLRQECDRLADALAEAEARHKADEDLKRTEWVELTRAFEEVRRKAELHAQDAAERGELLQGLRTELEQQRQEIEKERREYRKGLATQRRDLEAEFRAELARERDQASANTQELRGELSSLQESVGRLQRERDEAVEQVGMIRLERDQLHDTRVRLESRLQEVEEHHFAEVEGLARGSEDARRRAESATRREAQLSDQLRALNEQLAQQRWDPEAGRHEQQETLGRLHHEIEDSLLASWTDGSVCTEGTDGMRHDEPHSDVVYLGPEATSLPKAEPTPNPPFELIRELDASDTPAAPETIVGDSAQDRIHSLRNHLRVVHEARSKDRSNRPFFSNLSRIWKSSNADR